MPFLYPRVVDLHRSKNVSQQTPSIGGVGYSGREETGNYTDLESEIVLQTGIACTIQARGIGRATGAQILPGDVSRAPQWRILTPPMPKNTIRDSDILVDEDGYRYQVALNYWSPMGYRLDCIRLET